MLVKFQKEFTVVWFQIKTKITQTEQFGKNKVLIRI